MSELEKVFVSRKTFGKYTGTLEWYVKDDVWIDNCFKSTVTDRAGNIIEVTDTIRFIPERIRPDHIAPPPIEGEPPIEGTGKLWYFDPPHLSEDYIFEPLLTKPIVAWVIKVNDDIYIFDSKTGEQIGRNILELSSATFVYNDFPGERPESGKAPTKAAFSQLGFSNIDKTIAADIGASKKALLNILSNNDVKYFYLRAHGSTQGAAGLNFINITRAMEDRTPIWFAILVSCNIMEYTGYGSISYALRKGSMKGTVTLGLKISSTIGLSWQKKLYEHAVAGYTWWDSYNYADAAVPHLSGRVAFCGDKSMKIAGSTEIKRPTGIDKFIFSEVVENHLPEYAVGYICWGQCYSDVAVYSTTYTPPEGYRVTACEWSNLKHGCHPKTYTVVRVRCDKIGSVPPKTQIKAATTPSGASIWLKKY